MSSSARVIQDLRDLGVDDLLTHPEVPDVVDGVESYKIHPLVGHALNKMTGDLGDLAAAKSVAESDQQKLADVKGEASSQMGQGATIKRSMASTEALIHKYQAKLRTLGGQGVRIEDDKAQLERTLRDVMEPKIHNAETRVEKRRKGTEELQHKVDAWGEKQREYKANAMKRLEERRSGADELKAADEAAVKAQQEQAVAEEEYEKSRKEASRSVEEFRYVETRYKAAEDKVKEFEPEVAQEEKSLGHMKTVLQFEAHRIDEAEVAKKARLAELVKATEKQEEDQEHEMSLLKTRYSDWRESEKERAAVVAQRKSAYDSALGAYQDRHADVFAKAETNAAQRANKDADWGWDDWAWSGGANPSDAQDEEVSLS